MKGVVFIKFMDMVESEFGDDVLDTILENTELESGGIYTAVGYYSHQEIVALTLALSKEVNIDVPSLLDAFGFYLFGQLHNSNPALASFANNAFELMAGVESVIHPEVLKLYPDAELPRFEVVKHTENELQLVYKSSRHFDDLAEGLMKGCLAHYNESATIKRSPYDSGTLFTLNL